MKRSSQFSKTPVNLGTSVHQRLTAYALAATAAGVGAVSVEPAQAKIVYTPTHHTLTNGTLPIPIGGTHDFTLSDKFYIITGSWSTQLLNVNVATRAYVVGSNGSAAALKHGAVVGPKDKFQNGKMLMAGGFCETQISSSKVFGPFANKMHRYLGLKFKLHGKDHYGWARFSMVKAFACNGGPAVSATLTGYAYETVAGRSIKAGQTKESSEFTFHPASLGILALGAQAIPLQQRKE